MNMEVKPAGLSTKVLSNISSSGKGGWFNRISKRLFKRHMDHDIFNIDNKQTKNYVIS